MTRFEKIHFTAEQAVQAWREIGWVVDLRREGESTVAEIHPCPPVSASDRRYAAGATHRELRGTQHQDASAIADAMSWLKDLASQDTWTRWRAALIEAGGSIDTEESF